MLSLLSSCRSFLALKPYSTLVRSVRRSSMSGRRTPISSASRRLAHICERMFAIPACVALPPKFTSMMSRPSCLHRSTTPPPTPPPSIRMASGRFSRAISAMRAANCMVSSLGKICLRQSFWLSASLPCLNQMTLLSSPKRATSTPMMSGSCGPTSVSRSTLSSYELIGISCSEPASGNMPRTLTL